MKECLGLRGRGRGERSLLFVAAGAEGTEVNARAAPAIVASSWTRRSFCSFFVFDSGKWRHLCPLAALAFPYSIPPFLMQFLSFPPLRVLSFSASYFWPHGWREAVWVILLLFLLLSSNWTGALNTTAEKIKAREDGNKKHILHNLCKTKKKEQTCRVIRTCPEKEKKNQID